MVMGTRPEVIKMAPVISAFNAFPRCFDTKVCVTAQHRELLDTTLAAFRLIPDVDLNIMQKGQNLFDVTTDVLSKMGTALAELQPDLVLVQGDTTTTFATALAAFYQKIHVGHIEAGLRTNNMYSPYPEEVNRRLTTTIARYHFAPTELNKQNLLKENISPDDILVTGNTVIDTLFMVLDQFKRNQSLEEKTIATIRKSGYGSLANPSRRRFILVTGHRRENFGQGFLNICKALKKIAAKYPETDIVYPVHLNPNVQKPVGDILSGIPNIYLIEPLDYVRFVYLMAHCFFILTDSGGIQEEAPSLGKPTLVMRETTERPEAVNAGTVKMVGTNPDKIFRSAHMLLTDKDVFEKMAKAHNPYGDGKASSRIVEFVKNRVKSS